jgi:hypothetical protein
MSLLGWYPLLFALALANFFLGLSQLKSFLSQYSSISNTIDLEAFKRMVRIQMNIAIMQIVFLGAALVVGIYGIIMDELGLLVVLLMNGIIFVLGKSCKGIEERVRSLPVDEILKSEFRNICRTWLHKPFPDF